MKPKYKIQRARRPVRQKKLNPVEKQQVKRIAHIGTEVKFNDQQFNTLAFPAPATMTILPIISLIQNVTDTSRVGDQINLKSITLAYRVQQSPDTPVGIKENHTCRIMVIQWKGPTTPVQADIVQYAAGNYIAPYTKDRTRKLLKVIYDRLIDLGDAGPQCHSVKTCYLKNFAKKITFFSAANTPQDGQIYLCLCSDFAAAPGEVAPTGDFVMRVEYTDC